MGNRLLADRYELTEEIGRGGMATVWRAVDRRLDRPVAVKIAHTDHDDDGFAKRIEREARLAAGITHRNVVTVYDSGTDNGAPFLVMELLDGRPLSEGMGSLGRPAAVEMAAELADGLAAIHAAGIVHRDVKPGNIVITSDGPKLTDFGIARAGESDRLTRTNQIVGTPTYAAPEVLAGSAVGPTSDVYSLGVVLSEMMSGVRPTAGSPHVEVGDPSLDAVLAAALDVDPLRRPAASELAAALRRGRLATTPMAPSVHAGPDTIRLGPPPEPVAAQKPSSSSRWSAVFTVLAAAVMVVAAAGMGALLARQPDNGPGDGAVPTTGSVVETTEHTTAPTSSSSSVPVVEVTPSTTTTSAPDVAEEIGSELITWAEKLRPSELKPKDAEKVVSSVEDLLDLHRAGDPKGVDKKLGELERLVRRVDGTIGDEGMDLFRALAAALS